MNRLHGAVLCGLLLFCPSFGAQKDKNHNDAFILGDATESRIAREVRHQLVTLPYRAFLMIWPFGSTESR